MTKAAKKEIETPDYAAMLKRMCKRYGDRVADADPEDLTEMAEVLAVLQEAVQVAVEGQRANGASWAVIGRAFGITRQSAQERFVRFSHRAASQ